jgi:ubiquinone/menaquinone biosynthesis C-methylase UbiE
MKLKADDNLAPIRKQMMDLVEPNSKVIEFGCGKGDLLFTLAPKIQSGLGIDKSNALINDAIRQKQKRHISHIDFLCEALGNHFAPSETYDFSMASLFFHVIPTADAVYLLNIMREISDTTLICGFSQPDTLSQKLLLWLDQRFSGHYRNFRAYQKHGYMQGILAETKCTNVVEHDTSIPVVKIYKVN